MKTLFVIFFFSALASQCFAIYDSTQGRFLSRDLIQEAGGINLYGFVENDPISSYDAYGLKKVTIWAAAFIEPSSITFPYPHAFAPLAEWDGDGRTFGPGKSSRAWHKVTIETDPAKQSNPVITNDSGSGTTTARYWNQQVAQHSPTGSGYITVSGTAPPPVKANVKREPGNPCLVKVKIVARSSNPLTPGSPAIDYSYELTFNEGTGKVFYRGSHDVFPWHELYIDDTALVNATPGGPLPFKSPADLALPSVKIPVKSTNF